MLKRIIGTLPYCGFFFLAAAFFLIIPPNSGSDELWSARAAWYLSENPRDLFQKSEIVSYEFPGSLVMPNEKIGQSIPYPCFFEKVETPSGCQILSEDSNSKVAQFDRVFRSAPFYFVVGKFMQVSPFGSVYWSGKIAALILNMILIALSLILMTKASEDRSSNYLAFMVSALPIFYFSLGAISPIGFEISCSYLFLSTMLFFLKEHRSNYKQYFALFLVFTSGMLLALSRPLGGIWGILLLLLVSRLARTSRSLVQVSLVSTSLGLLIQTRIDNATWRFGNGDTYKVEASLEFYLEETVRVFLNMGNWFRQIFGLWTFGAAPELPLLFTFVSLTSIVFIVYWVSVQLSNKWKISSIFLFGVVLVPFMFSILFSTNWPMWWSGRYQLPFLLPAIYLLATRISYERQKVLFAISAFTSFIYILTLFARFNWGLYGNGTPVMQNNSSFSLATIVTWLLFTTLWIFSCLILLRREKT
jgi:hypothetical protein